VWVLGAVGKVFDKRTLRSFRKKREDLLIELAVEVMVGEARLWLMERVGWTENMGASLVEEERNLSMWCWV